MHRDSTIWPGVIRGVLRYGFAAGATSLAVLLTRLLWPALHPGFFELFLAAVVLSAWWAGFGPALFAALLSVGAVDYYFIPPVYAIELSVGNLIRLAVFGGVSLLIVGLIGAERRARERADAVSRAKDRMLAVVSHDLRGPLNAVAGWAHVLRRGVRDATCTRALDVIDRSIEAQRRLIDDLLDMVRMEAGAVRLDRRPVEVAAVVGASVDAIRPTADAKGVALELSVVGGPHVAYVDPVRLEQATGNLLANAVQSTPGQGRIVVTVAEGDRRVVIRVRDSGAGIPAEALGGLLPLLEEAPVRSRRRGEGLGIGLAIARWIVELHGGTLQAASDGPDAGALFTIALPRAVGPGAAREGNRSSVLSRQARW
jgi:signal transduction histidine kinase